MGTSWGGPEQSRFCPKEDENQCRVLQILARIHFQNEQICILRLMVVKPARRATSERGYRNETIHLTGIYQGKRVLDLRLSAGATKTR